MKRTALILISLSVMAFGGWKEEFKKAEKENNPEKVCKILQEEVDKKNFHAMWFLAARYESMDGCGKGIVDYKKAFSLYTELASHDYSMGYNGLHRMYEKGLGVEADPQKAFDYMMKSAEGKSILD